MQEATSVWPCLFALELNCLWPWTQLFFLSSGLVGAWATTTAPICAPGSFLGRPPPWARAVPRGLRLRRPETGSLPRSFPPAAAQPCEAGAPLARALLCCGNPFGRRWRRFSLLFPSLLRGRELQAAGHPDRRRSPCLRPARLRLWAQQRAECRHPSAASRLVLDLHPPTCARRRPSLLCARRGPSAGAGGTELGTPRRLPRGAPAGPPRQSDQTQERLEAPGQASAPELRTCAVWGWTRPPHPWDP